MATLENFLFTSVCEIHQNKTNFITSNNKKHSKMASKNEFIAGFENILFSNNIDVDNNLGSFIYNQSVQR